MTQALPKTVTSKDDVFSALDSAPMTPAHYLYWLLASGGTLLDGLILNAEPRPTSAPRSYTFAAMASSAGPPARLRSHRDQSASRRRAHRGSGRGNSVCRKTGPRPAQGRRGHYRVGWRCSKTASPMCSTRLRAAKRSRYLREGPWHRPGHGATVEISSAAGCGGAAGSSGAGMGRDGDASIARIYARMTTVLPEEPRSGK
jgi:hypothetical protein